MCPPDRGAEPPPAIPADGRQERSDFYDRAAALTPYLGVGCGSATFVVSTADRQVGRSLFTKGSRGEMRILRRAVIILEILHGDGVVAGSGFLDVGANIGTTTVPALLDNGFGSAIAFEPDPDTFRTLALNSILNGVSDRMDCMQVAVSNQAGLSILFGTTARGGKHRLTMDADIEKRAREEGLGEEVVTVTLDDLAGDGRLDPASVGMLWMDAQGSEGHVLEGATALTGVGVPVVLEWDPLALGRVDGLDKAQSVAAKYYTHFISLRREPAENSDVAFQLRPTSELPEYQRVFTREGRKDSFTDIMLLKLEAGQVVEGDLGPEVRLRERADRPPRPAARSRLRRLRPGRAPAGGR